LSCYMKWFDNFWDKNVTPQKASNQECFIFNLTKLVFLHYLAKQETCKVYILLFLPQNTQKCLFKTLQYLSKECTKQEL